MNRKLQFVSIVLALGAWNVASAQTPAPKPITQVAQAGNAASRTIVAQAPEAAGGIAAGAESTMVIGGTTLTTTAVSTTALLTTATLGGVAQAATDGTTAPASHTP